MEIFFLDVAQGTCQVILLGDRRAIVIDCGAPTDRFLVQFLSRMGIEYLDCLIVSHSHDDHVGGAVTVLGEYQDRIDKICFVQDDLFLTSAFWHRISELLRDGTLTKDQLHRLEVTPGPQPVWSDGLTGARLRTFSPSAAENLVAQAAKTPNPTSAILFLDVKNGRVIFAADSEVAQWREVNRRSGRKWNCDVLAVPHHAGHAATTPEDLAWLFDEAIAPKVAIVSVGTSNTFGHPRPDVVQAMTSRGIKVMCTQITGQCTQNLEIIRPGVLRPVVHPGRSSARRDLTTSANRNSRNVACAGSVRAVVGDSGIAVDRLDEHQAAVDKLAGEAHGCPLCRP